VVVEVTEGLPYVFGEQNGVHVSEVDYIIEGDHKPAAELPNPPPNEIDRAVARRIAEEIEDGACLQVGIGGMPNAVCTLLLESGVHALGVHTEMLTDGIVELYKAGRISGTSKMLNPGKIVYDFALGSSALYATAHRNPDFLSYRHRPSIGPRLRKRQEGLCEEVKEIAWKAQHRLHKRYRTLSAAGKKKQKVITAVGRELLGFIWAIGVQVERNRKPVA
jgi:hypothetical protein